MIRRLDAVACMCREAEEEEKAELAPPEVPASAVDAQLASTKVALI